MISDEQFERICREPRAPLLDKLENLIEAITPIQQRYLREGLTSELNATLLLRMVDAVREL